MMVVVVDIDLIAIPLPVAATVEVVRGNYPVGAVVEDDIAGAVIDGARDENFPNVLVVTTGIVAARNDAVVLIVPAAIIGAGFLLFPAFVLAVVMTVAVVAVLVPSFVLAIVVVLVTAVIAMVIAVLGRSGQGESAS
jgi:hypothetical protein